MSFFFFLNLYRQAKTYTVVITRSKLIGKGLQLVKLKQGSRTRVTIYIYIWA